MPLRNPGESLEGEMQRLLNDRAMIPFMAATLALMFAVWEWWHWLAAVPPQPIPASIVAVAVIAYAAREIVSFRKRVRSLRLGLDGEKSVGQFLEAHRKEGWRILHDIPGKGFNVDHVLIAPQGVFAIETKTFSKPVRGDATAEFDGERLLVNGFEPDRNAIAQARAARDWVRELLYETTAIRYPVRGVVVLPGWYVRRPKVRKATDIWVLNPKALPSFIGNEPTALKDEDVALAYSRLSLHVVQFNG